MQQTKEEADRLSDQNSEPVKGTENIAKWHASKAGLMLLLGTLIAAVIADPLVDVVDNFSTATSIPSFFVSFVILPFASSSEVVSTLIFARKKKSRMSSLMYSEVRFSLLATLFPIVAFVFENMH